MLNERFGTAFTEGGSAVFRADQGSGNGQPAGDPDRDGQIRWTSFSWAVRKLIEDLMIQRMSENDKIVIRYMDDFNFQRTAFPILAREIFEAVRAEQSQSPGAD